MEKSESGAPIYRYNEADKRGFEGASGDSSIEEISNHIEEYVGKIHMVFHEIVSELIHIDIHWVKPTPDRPYHTLVTSGMSDQPMKTPEGFDGSPYAELSICLPEDWKISEEDFTDEENYWPVRWLKMLARFPHSYNTWLGYGHTIPNGDPAEPFTSDTELNTMVLLPSVQFDPGFHTLELENKKINFYALVPLYSEEVELKLKKGIEKLFDGFDKYAVSDVFELNRPNTVKKK
jgi:hypothetical protein